jgi:CheY-like chemotaxis protein
MMPVMNGWELRAEIARLPMHAKVPIVVMTALAGAAKVEADAIIAKPIDLKRLLRIMDDLLTRRIDTQGSSTA